MQETLWLFNTLKNEDGRLCGLLGSSIGYFFAQAEAVCQGIRNRELRHYTRVLENTLGVKRSYYNGVAHYFFNGRSAKRRRRAQEHLEGAMQLLTRVESAFRKQVWPWAHGRCAAGAFDGDAAAWHGLWAPERGGQQASPPPPNPASGSVVMGLC